ncbi:MAG: hypothetical protein AAB391_03670 [Patescibacteria group bacterium]
MSTALSITMLKYFDHTFFKIVSSFVGILAMSLALFALAGTYRESQLAVPAEHQRSAEQSTR